MNWFETMAHAEQWETKAEVAAKEMAKEAVHWAPRFGLSLIVFFSFWIAAAVLTKFARRGIRYMNSSRQVILHMFTKVGKTTLILFGTATALGTLGVNVSAIVAGLGLTGFALGFALRDMLSNIVSGTMILLYQPFRVSDRIVAAGFEGIVKEIDLRYTVLEKDNEIVFIPNSSLVTNPIVKKDAKGNSSPPITVVSKSGV